MSGGFAKDGAAQEQIDASLQDEVNRARSRLPQGDSALECDECGATLTFGRSWILPYTAAYINNDSVLSWQPDSDSPFNHSG